MGNTVIKPVTDPEKGLFPSGMTPAMRKYRPKPKPKPKEYQSSYKQGDWKPLRRPKEKPAPVVRTKKICEPMEPYPDPFIGGYELANMVEVDLRRNMPVTEILAEPEPEPEKEPEPEPAPEPEPEQIIEPLIEMPPLITEYIQVKTLDNFTKFERCWYSILIMGLIISAIISIIIPPRKAHPENYYIFMHDDFYNPGNITGQIYGLTRINQNEVEETCLNFQNQWNDHSAENATLLQNWNVNLTDYPDLTNQCGNFTYYPPANPLDDIMYNSLLFLERNQNDVFDTDEFTIHAPDHDEDECTYARTTYLATSHDLEIFNDDCTKGSREDIIFTCKFTCKMPTSIYLTTAPQTTTTWMNASTSTPHTTSTTTDNPCRITDSGTITVC